MRVTEQGVCHPSQITFSLMRTTTVATIAAHRASFYCVLLFLCGLSIVWQNTGHLRVVVFGRELSYMRVARGLGTELQDR